MLAGWLDTIGQGPALRPVALDRCLAYCWSDRRTDDLVAFARSVEDALHVLTLQPSATVCCLETKTYTKRLTRLEQTLLKPLSGNKARFTSTVNFAADPRRKPA